jgi:sporulation protein YlmC with PRC-barrel domain
MRQPEFFKEINMEIPMNAEVQCSDGLCGHTTCIVVNPITQKITHVVVKEKQPSHTERMVPESYILDTTPESIQLRCKLTELSMFDEFVVFRFVQADMPTHFPLGDETVYWPYSVPDEMALVLPEERIPPGELAIQRGARVEASDGHIGKVDEFLIDPTDGKVTHLILREGHLWDQKDVTIPVSEIEKISNEAVYIKLNKQAIARLPAIPVHRKWK